MQCVIGERQAYIGKEKSVFYLYIFYVKRLEKKHTHTRTTCILYRRRRNLSVARCFCTVNRVVLVVAAAAADADTHARAVRVFRNGEKKNNNNMTFHLCIHYIADTASPRGDCRSGVKNIVVPVCCVIGILTADCRMQSSTGGKKKNNKNRAKYRSMITHVASLKLTGFARYRHGKGRRTPPDKSYPYMCV